MRRTLLFFALVAVCLACPLYAQTPSDRIDDTFRKTEQWLRQENLSITKNPTQAFMDNYIIAEGQGLPSRDATTRGEKRLTAERAAEITAYRNLAQMLDGVAVVGDSTTAGMALRYDSVRTAVKGFIQGAKVIHKEYNDQDETALVLIKVGLTGPASFGEVMYARIFDDPNVANAVRTTARPLDTTKMPVAPPDGPYDGIIIDATDQNFRPALINRIFTRKGELLYDPSKVNQKILIEKGCGEYTNSIDKAKAALGSRGAKNPFVVKAAGVSNPTDILVSEEDAVKIFAANQKSAFLSEAKVAFVLK